jgi:hypothetical protein
MTPTEFRLGGYSYLPGVYQYSAGVAALAGFEIVRVTFRNAPKDFARQRKSSRPPGAR